jgi:hypothetical protein
MPKGWKQAMSGEKEQIEAPMKCEECGHEWMCTGGNGVLRISKRRLNPEDSEYYYQQACPSCGTFTRSDQDKPFAEACGKKPTKRLVKGDHVYKVHKRDRMAFPSNLKEVVERSNELLRENGYAIPQKEGTDGSAAALPDGRDDELAGGTGSTEEA